MKLEWDDVKQQRNLRKHGLDFARCEEVLLGPNYTYADERDYDEPRSITIGILDGNLVVVVSTERGDATRIISMRPANKQENSKYGKAIFGYTDDAPALTGQELHRPEGKWRIGGKVVSAEEGKAAFRKAWKRKIRTNIHLDSDVIAHYKSLAGTRGYQTLINAALRREMEGATFKIEMMRAIKAELTDPLKTELQTMFTNVVGLASGNPGNIPVFSGLSSTFVSLWGLTGITGGAIAGASALPPSLAATGDFQGLNDATNVSAITTANSSQQFFGLKTPVQGSA